MTFALKCHRFKSWCGWAFKQLGEDKEKKRYSTTARAHKPNSGRVWRVIQKNQPADQFQVTAPIQSHNLPLDTEILLKSEKLSKYINEISD